MSNTPARNYNCKDEELPVIAEYLLYSLNHDLADFTAFSPKFDKLFVADFEAKIAASGELVNSREETLELKVITQHLYGTMDETIVSLNHLEGYIKMAKGNIPISVADFGLPALRKKLYTKDAEGTMNAGRLVVSNIEKYKAALTAEGMTEAFESSLKAAFVSIDADNTKQYEIARARRDLVQNNVGVLNDLFAQMTEIFEVGKILYRKTKPEKAEEYTFTYLLKKVRIIHHKPSPPVQPEEDKN